MPTIVYYGQGSPPRMRGKVIRGLATRITSGITPAYAGKSTPRRCRLYGQRDHPRVCGEKKRLASCAAQAEGSPPRMRGKAELGPGAGPLPGITPAYAGKRCPRSDCVAIARDHPRVCGEKGLMTLNYQRKLGSPPRMRGKGVPGATRGSLGGITPAYAGKRLCPLVGRKCR